VIENGSRDIANNELQYDNDFWRFSLAVYEPGAVENECLALQETLGIDVNILLFCAWLGTRNIVLSREIIEAACRTSAHWHNNIVRPLRSVRRQMKMYDDKVANLRTRVKDIELEAEQVEQAMLFAYAQGIAGSREATYRGDAIAHNVNEYIAMQSDAVRSQHKIAAPLLIRAAQRLAV
jgi:uncharacterized protein (TIGR02444 family)